MASLPWAEAEAESLISLAHKANWKSSLAHVGEEATLGRVKQELQRPREQPGAWVEIASHGHADPIDPHNCYLLLAHNERLTLTAVQHERLLEGIRCFIAGGCVTGLGDMDTAPDELSSFAAGVLQAGAACAIATLWPVSDRATFLLMLRFQQRILGDPHISPAQALRDAARWLRQATRSELDQLARGGLKSLRPLPREDEALTRDALRGASSQDGKELFEEDLSDSLRLSEEQALGQFRLVGKSEQASECPYTHPIYWASVIIYGV
jgi:CHAT domain-containing protein